MPDTTARDFLAAARRLREAFFKMERVGNHGFCAAFDAFMAAHPTAEDAEKEIGRAARSEPSSLPNEEGERLLNAASVLVGLYDSGETEAQCDVVNGDSPHWDGDDEPLDIALAREVLILHGREPIAPSEPIGA
ncbi:MAG: hypothetical protein JWN27_2925 [Candidatus Eremiobacteraeota bacterium]|nr:hypothetical protein [Candidatus Eremiobacteraeota bacterium]